MENSASGATVIALSRRGRLGSALGTGGAVRVDHVLAAFELVVLQAGGVMVVGVSRPALAASVWRVSATGTIESRRDIPMAGFGPSTVAASRVPGKRVAVAIAAEVAAPRRRATVIARLTERNAPDPDFGEDGIVRVASPPDAEVGSGAIAVRPNGAIVVAGQCRFCTGPSVRISQLDASGDIDERFGGDGRIRLSSRRLNRIGIGVRGLSLAGDGDLLVGLARGSVVRVDGGRTERRFGVDGVTRTGFAVGAAGKPLVLRSGGTLSAGLRRRSSRRPSLVAHTPGGDIDRSFGRAGRFVIRPPRGSKSARVEAMTLDAEGRVLIAGRAYPTRRPSCCGRLTAWRLIAR